MQTTVPSSPPSGAVRPRILHVSGDFPDPIEPFKTKVVEALLELTDDRFDHSVISLNRVSPSVLGIAGQIVSPGPLKTQTEPFERGIALTYQAPPRGIRHLTKLQQLGDWLKEHIQSQPKAPDLIVGHKLAIEGIAVRRAAQSLGIPYALSIQGDSDTKIMSVRRDLNPEFGAVLQGSKMTFPFTPWAWDFVVRQLGAPPGDHILLPCPTDLDQPLEPQPGGDGLISVFHLMSHKRKNLAGLAKAAMRLQNLGDSVPVTVIGGGEASERAACEAIIKGLDSLTLAGPMNRQELRARMRSASGFVLPSLRESFGLVFIEALFAGLPIIYPKGTAVDGYFEGAPFAIKVDARDSAALAEAMRSLVKDERQLKASLGDWLKSDDAKKFQRPQIAEDFARGLIQAVG